MALPTTGYDLGTYPAPSADIVDDFSVIDDLGSNATASFWGACSSADGTKMRYAKDADGAELAFDPMNFNTTGQTGQARINVGPILAASTAASRTVRRYPSDSGNASYAAGAAYGQHAAYASHWAGYWPDGGGQDRTANARHGSAQGGVTVGAATGPDGQPATLFDGVDDWVNVGSAIDDAVQTAGAGTWCAWANPTANDDDQSVLLLTSHIKLWLDAGGAGKGWAGAAWNASAVPTVVGSDFSNATLNEWAMPGMAWDGATLRTYKDGVETGSAALASINTQSNGMGIGGDSVAPGSFTGRITGLQVHTAALSAAWQAYERTLTVDNAAAWGAWTWQAAAGGGAVVLPPALFNQRMI